MVDEMGNEAVVLPTKDDGRLEWWWCEDEGEDDEKLEGRSRRWL